MSFPKTINRNNTELMNFSKLVEEFDYNNSDDHILKLEFKTKSKAKYKRDQLYALWRTIHKEQEEAGMDSSSLVKFPEISLKKNFLFFSHKTQDTFKKRFKFKIVNEKYRKEIEEKEKRKKDDSESNSNINSDFNSNLDKVYSEDGEELFKPGEEFDSDSDPSKDPMSPDYDAFAFLKH